MAETVKEPPTNNDDRANWAKKALEAFVAETKSNDDEAICDLICDLCHLAARTKKDALDEVRRGLIMYADERDYPPNGWVPNDVGRTDFKIEMVRAYWIEARKTLGRY